MGRRSKYDAEFKRNAIVLSNEEGRKVFRYNTFIGGIRVSK